jgi:hypothetical protein
MKIMAKDSSATTREQTPHANRTTRTATIIDALKRRAQAILNDESIDPESRAIIRYALETNDPWLAELVRRADKEESIIDAFDPAETPSAETQGTSEIVSERDTSRVDSTFENQDDDSTRQKIEALAEIICGGGEESAGALFVLMGTLANCADAKAFAHTAKHFAFTHCGELNLYGIVDAEMAVVEGKLFAGKSGMF